MKFSLRHLAIGLGVWNAATALGAGSLPWARTLAYDGGGYWRMRLPVRVVNSGSTRVSGGIVSVPISPSGPAAGLIGRRVGELRVVDGSGHECLFAVEDSRGEMRRDGTLAAGDAVLLPVDVPGRGSETLWVYAGNPRAWTPPRWLAGRGRLVNLGFEQGTDGEPRGWTSGAVDAAHRMTRQRGGAHSGLWCARCEVDKGASPSWVQYRQGGLPVATGEKYRFTAWVKGSGVHGLAGWYVHVDGIRPQMVNRVAGRQGTFDWHRIEIEFSVPPGGRRFTCGTVLHGSGTAWFDDAFLEKLEASVAKQLQVRPERIETCELRRLGPADAGSAGRTDWLGTAQAVVRNFSAAGRRRVMVRLETRRFWNSVVKVLGFAASPRLEVAAPDGTPAPWSGDPRAAILFQAELPPRSESVFLLRVSAEGAQRPGGVRVPPEWMRAPANLVGNPGMEAGRGSRPAAWKSGVEGQPSARFQARRVRGGVEGAWCVELTVPEGVKKPGWSGWRQKVPVRPGTRYRLAGFIRCRGADVPVRIHGHFLRADGRLTEQPYFSTTPSIRGTQDWTLTQAIVTTPPDCRTIEVHLTMNGHGTVWHDAVMLSEIVEGRAGPLVSARRPKASWYCAAVNPRVKVFPDDPPPAPLGAEPVRVYVARNARRACQLLVWSSQRRKVRLRAGVFRGPGGAVLPAPALYRVGYVPVDFPVGYDSTSEPDWRRHRPRRRGDDGWPGLWPDPLIPLAADSAVELDPGRLQPFLCDFTIPSGAAPGEYHGRVEIRDGAGGVLRAPVTVRVWSLRIPGEKPLSVLIDLRNGPGPKAFGGRGGAARLRAIRRWYRFLARYNVSPSYVYPAPAFHYAHGHVTMDAGEFDRSAALLLDELGIRKVYTPGIFYACGWAYPPKKVFGLKPFTPEYVRAWSEAYREFVNHITAKGWRDRFVFYISDEPHDRSEETITGIARIADMARKIAPDIPVYSSTWHYIPGLAGHVNLWGAGPQGSFDAAEMAARRRAGDHFWYTTDGQMCLDTPYLGIEYLLPWFCLKYRTEGWEFWGVSWWTWDPWKQGWHWYISQSSNGKEYRWVRYPNGDGYLAYPGADIGRAGPQPSLRLVAVREGVDDFAILRRIALAASRGNAAARTLLDQALDRIESPNIGGRWSTAIMPDPDAIERIRVRLGEMLERISAGR